MGHKTAKIAFVRTLAGCLAAYLLAGCEEAAPEARTKSRAQSRTANLAATTNTGKDSGDTKGEKEKKEKKDDKEDDGKISDSDTTTTESGELEPSEGSEDDEPAPTTTVYPLLTYTSYDGSTSCDGRYYGTFSETSALLSGPKLDVATTKAWIDYNEKANEQLRASAIGITSYDRVSSEELRAAGKDGFDVQPSLIYAKGVTKKDGTVLTFDKFIPVYAFPVAKGAYEIMKKGNRKWSTTVTMAGHPPFALEVEVSAKSLPDGLIEMHIANHIPADTDGRYYEAFPSPRAQTYNIDASKRMITTLVSAHNWLGDENCDGNSEWTVLKYKLCKKEKNGEIENYCP